MEQKVINDLKRYRNDDKSVVLGRFFKTGKGQYGEGDIFWGIDVPTSRKVADKYTNLPKKLILNLLQNKVHEVRLVGLLILVAQYRKAEPKAKAELVKFYLDNTKHVNNWDLVDSTAHQILGDSLVDKNDRKILLTLSHSKDLWEQRIAIVATFAFIRRGELEWTYKIVDTLDKHHHDLIHKACGWMLREAGKKDEKRLKEYLDKKAATLPRTMLRYAIEKFPEKERRAYLAKV